MGVTLGVLIAGAPARAQWSQFRGPNGSGVDAAPGYPTSFSPSENVVWKAALPYGQSSPVDEVKRVYLTARDGDLQKTICIDATTGRESWRREIRRSRRTDAYKENDPASPTPAADDNGVVVFFADYGLAAYAPDGTERWKVPLGPFKNFYGMAASPILADGLAIVLCDQQGGSFVAAFDVKTGRQRWRVNRPEAMIGWATPIVFRSAGADASQLVVLDSLRLDGYALDTGEARWWMPLGSGGSMGVPLVHGDLLLVSTLGSSDPLLPAFESTLAPYDKDKDGRLSRDEFNGDKELGEHFGWIDIDSDGFITATEWNTTRMIGVGLEFGAVALRPATLRGRVDPAAVIWRSKKNLPYIPAPLVYGDVLYLVKTGGIITALDPITGQLLKEGRSREALGEYFASPVAADGKIYLANVDGKITVLRAGREWDVLRVNDLGAEVHAPPAWSSGRIFIRTRDALYCFGSASESVRR
jgi:outer membrane protein assembly factor BamB